MDLQEAKAILESILFVAGEPVTIGQLAETLQTKRSLASRAVRSLAEEYQKRGLRIQYERGRVQMVTAPKMSAMSSVSWACNFRASFLWPRWRLSP